MEMNLISKPTNSVTSKRQLVKNVAVNWQISRLENSPKIIRALIGQKSCFYNSIETQN